MGGKGAPGGSGTEDGRGDARGDTSFADTVMGGLSQGTYDAEQHKRDGSVVPRRF